jgi:hypothetical protein
LPSNETIFQYNFFIIFYFNLSIIIMFSRCQKKFARNIITPFIFIALLFITFRGFFTYNFCNYSAAA